MYFFFAITKSGWTYFVWLENKSLGCRSLVSDFSLQFQGIRKRELEAKSQSWFLTDTSKPSFFETKLVLDLLPVVIIWLNMTQVSVIPKYLKFRNGIVVSQANTNPTLGFKFNILMFNPREIGVFYFENQNLWHKRSWLGWGASACVMKCVQMIF